MVNFRTELRPAPSGTPIDLHDPVLTIGSCFADTLGGKLNEHKFKVLTNPFGVTYNPHAIHTLLHYALYNQVAPEHTYIENNGIQLNYQFHSALSALKRVELEKKITALTGSVHYFLKDARWLIITYGTAWVYSRKDTGEIVANCHKMPASMFNKELLTQKRMLDSFEEFYTTLKTFNKDINILLTVSPVRHIKDTLELNSVSKSVLRLGCHTITRQHEDVHYFPAYELLLDDLRDYRFYKSDLIHPSEEAESYIWEKFLATWLNEPTQNFIEKWGKIKNALNHKAFHPSTPTHQAFLKNLLLQLEEINSEVSVQEEISHVKEQLI